jgi:integrase
MMKNKKCWQFKISCQHFFIKADKLESCFKYNVKTVKYFTTLLRSSLEDAKANGLISSNPADNVNLPQGERKVVSALSLDKQKLFMKEIKLDEYNVIFTLDLFTGLRVDCKS